MSNANLLSMFDAASSYQQTLNETSGDPISGSKRIEYAGGYRVRNKNARFKAKDPKPGEDEFKVYPHFSVASTGTVMQNYILTTVGDNDGVPEGSDIYYTTPALPKSGASSEDAAKIFKFAKPTLKTLLGIDEIVLSSQFMQKNILCDYDAQGNVTRQNKITGDYFIEVEIDKDKPLNNKGKWNLKVRSFAPYTGQKTYCHRNDPTSARDSAASGGVASQGYGAAPTAADISVEDSMRPSHSQQIDDDLPF